MILQEAFGEDDDDAWWRRWWWWWWWWWWVVVNNDDDCHFDEAHVALSFCLRLIHGLRSDDETAPRVTRILSQVPLFLSIPNRERRLFGLFILFRLFLIFAYFCRLPLDTTLRCRLCRVYGEPWQWSSGGAFEGHCLIGPPRRTGLVYKANISPQCVKRIWK